MPREKSPGLKILWVWTIGTAAVLVTSVVRSRLRDLDNLMTEQQQQQQQQHGTIIDSPLVETLPQADQIIPEDKV